MCWPSSSSQPRRQPSVRASRTREQPHSPRLSLAWSLRITVLCRRRRHGAHIIVKRGILTDQSRSAALSERARFVRAQSKHMTDQALRRSERTRACAECVCVCGVVHARLSSESSCFAPFEDLWLKLLRDYHTAQSAELRDEAPATIIWYTCVPRP